MNKLYFCIVLCIFFSCKKDQKDDSLKKNSPTENPFAGKRIKIDTVLIVSFKSKILNDFYKSENYKTVWQSEKNRKTVLKNLESCAKEGLDPSDYNIDKLKKTEKKFIQLDKKELIFYDLLLSYNFQKYLLHLHNGKLNPRLLYNNWDLDKSSFDVNYFLNEALTKNTFTEVIEKCKPTTITYKKLLKALEIINTFPDDKIISIESKDKITLNDTNKAMITIKKRLYYWKDLTGKDSITDIYDTNTEQAVKRFQKRHGLSADGVIGKGTVAALNFSKSQRKQQIIVNLERWRWFSKQFPENYIVINIPDYSLNVVEDNDTVVFSKVVVGKIKRKTPVLTSQLKTVVFNPTWTVPPTILKEDIVPEMKKNRNYLKNKGITIYDNDNLEVDPALWNENKPHSYRYVQSPGRNNSLGLMKILFPNHHSVYLHDTNHRNLFGNNNRSLSSGCVRVEHPLELAQHLLNNKKKWSKEKIDTIIASKKTTAIRIEKKYAIYLWYWTAWSDNDQLIFRDDIYNLDSELYTKLRK